MRIRSGVPAGSRPETRTFSKVMRLPLGYRSTETIRPTTPVGPIRAPIIGAEQLYAGLRRLGRTVGFVRYPREGHELSRSGEPKHRIDRLNRIVDWFDRHVGGKVNP